MKWNKDTFMNDMREKCSREIAKIGNSIIAKTKQTAGSVNMYAVFLSVLASVSFIKKKRISYLIRFFCKFKLLEFS